MATTENRRGRPRKEDIAVLYSDQYAEAELYDLWRVFRGQPDEIRMLEDFSGLGRNETIDLSTSFWQRWTHENAQNAP